METKKGRKSKREARWTESQRIIIVLQLMRMQNRVEWDMGQNCYTEIDIK